MMKDLIQRDRLYKMFGELVGLDALSFQERKSADYVKKVLADLNAEVYEDEAWKHYFEIFTTEDGEEKAKAIGNPTEIISTELLAGNVYGFVKGEIPGAPILFSAHLDTVPPGIGKEAVLGEDGVIQSKGETVLGADDFAGVVQILEAVRTLQENKIPHRSLELIFPIAEEVYTKGSRYLDYSQIHSKEAYVLDISGPIGIASLQAPTILSFQISIEGRSAHAGFEPEEGIHAIAVAADALNQLKMGRIGKDSTRNIGTIQGGNATNIVPDRVVLGGEIRSNYHEKAIDLLEETRRIFEKAAETIGANIKIFSEVQMKAYKVEEESAIIQDFKSACEKLNIQPTLTTTFGGSDNNNIVQNGIEGIVVSCGMQQIHTTQEFITMEDLHLGTALVMQLAVK